MLEKIVNKLNQKGEVYIVVKVRPNAPLSLIKEILSDMTLKIDIKAMPKRGRANNELIRLLSKIFSVSRDSVKIISGAGTRKKLIKLIK